ncbi:MAG: SulP family inorganic anion transporter [Burkholderiales bacterium]|nr:SulP family inorganic anion transporter [Burkholderiales bacterium]
MTSRLVRFLPFLAWRHKITAATLGADAQAGLVGALVVLPQGVAYATLAGLPPQHGLYCAMVPAIVAALWGSSWHLISGPTNALSLVVFATVAPLATPGSADYVTLVLTLCLLVGAVQFAMGLARLGTLVDFISHTVIVGFTAGAALLIVAAQFHNFFGISIPQGTGFFGSLHVLARSIGKIDPWITSTGAITIAVALASQRWLPRILPPMIVAMVAGSVFAWILGQAGIARVPTIGDLGSDLPPLSLPSFDPDTWARLAPAALALTVLGLTEAVSIARAMALKTGQRIDGSQEFIGQGLSNLAGAFFSAYPSSGSFNRSGLNLQAGAQTPMAAVASAIALVLVVVVVAPLARFLPYAVMAALLFIVAFGLFDLAEMRRIVRTSRSETLVLAVTFVATLATPLEYAILFGVMASLLVYLNRTTQPNVTPVLPDPSTPLRRFDAAPDPARRCPQLEILRLDGSLFFGAIEHVRDEIETARAARPGAKHMLLVGSGVNFIDVAGCEFLVHEAAASREAGVTLYATGLKAPVRDALEHGGFLESFGSERVFDAKADAIRLVYARLDVPTCRECRLRVFTECAVRLPDGTPRAD